MSHLDGILDSSIPGFLQTWVSVTYILEEVSGMGGGEGSVLLNVQVYD